MQRKEQDKAKAIDTLIKKNKLSHPSDAGELLEAAELAIKNAPMTFNIAPEKLSRLQGEGMINVWKTSKHVNTYIDRRDMLENQMFEYEKSTPRVTRQAARPGIHKSKAYTRPLYGALQIFDDSLTVGGAPTYGRAAFFLNESARPYMTFTAADSLSTKATLDSLASTDNLYPIISMMRPDTWEALFHQITGTGGPIRISESSNYIEWQSHAPVEWQTTDFIYFERKSDLEKTLGSPAAVNFFKENSISTRIKSLAL